MKYIAALFGITAAAAWAQQETVVVTATRIPQAGYDVPAAIDSVDARVIREDNAQVNLSEALNRVPGIVVQNRQNYSQDLQISSRGFGGRATFGVRGVRLITDGIPATMPDGQGQAATFDLATADHIEVLRGPFASLYGNCQLPDFAAMAARVRARCAAFGEPHGYAYAEPFDRIVPLP